MFERVKYKKAAKMVLAGNWKSAILVTLVSLVVTIICDFGSNGIDLLTESERVNNVATVNSNFTLDILDIISLLLTVASSVFLMAQCYFYIKLTSKNSSGQELKPNFETFLEGLSLWFKGILAFLWQSLWIFLWSLLFIIPGIVKAISYSMTFFIVAENPKISVTKALRISKILTHGHKADLFFMMLSFIGWLILCVFPPVLLYLMPYYFTSFAYSYRHMKAMAINEGRISPKDFE